MSTVGYLEVVEQRDSLVALGRAVRGFVQREEVQPAWVEVGEGVTLSPGVARGFGLERVTGRDCREGCVLVGIGDPWPVEKRVFWLSEDGDDKDDGLTPETALLSPDEVGKRVIAGEGEVIVRMGHGGAEDYGFATKD